MRKNIIPIWLAAILASVIPISVMACMQIRIRSFWDFNNAVVGLLYSLINAAVFQVFLKWLIGGLRPHFLAVILLACIPFIMLFFLNHIPRSVNPVSQRGVPITALASVR